MILKLNKILKVLVISFQKWKRNSKIGKLSGKVARILKASTESSLLA